MSKKQKFQNVWKNQTQLGQIFGISSIAFGKLLVVAGLKDPETKRATQKALDEGYAKFTPLKDDTPYYMWNKEKTKALISEVKKPLSEIDHWAYKINTHIKEARKLMDEGNDKFGYMMLDGIFNEVPKHIKPQVKEKIQELHGDLF